MEAGLGMRTISSRSNVLRGVKTQAIPERGQRNECEKVWETWLKQRTTQDLNSSSLLSLASDDTERRNLD